MSTRTFKNKSPNHYIVLRRPDGTQVNKSTGLQDKDTAEMLALHAKVLSKKEDASVSEVRDVVEGAVKAVYEASTGKTLPRRKVNDCLGSLLQEQCCSEAHLYTMERAVHLFDLFLESRGKQAVDISKIEDADAAAFKAHLYRLGLLDLTVRQYLGHLRRFFDTASKRDWARRNPFRSVKLPARPRNSPRRALTDTELNRLYEAASEEWKGMIRVGQNTGLRLGDVALLVFRDIDRSTRFIRPAVKKVRLFEPKPISPALMRYFEGLTWPQDLDTPLFPHAYRVWMEDQKANRLCQEFKRLAIKAGVRSAKTKVRGVPRVGASKYLPITFQCLRHTATTGLKKGKVSEAVARAIIGHRSISISDVYTHLGEDVMLQAVQDYPDAFPAAADESDPHPQLFIFGPP